MSALLVFGGRGGGICDRW